MPDNCCSSGVVALLYTCSGASDVGEIADRAARKLWKEGFAQKTCLAGVGAAISGFVQSAKGTDVNITIDGCPISCAKKCLERIGVKPEPYMLADFGFTKGKTPVTEDTINSVCALIKEKHSAAEDSSASKCSCC